MNQKRKKAFVGGLPFAKPINKLQKLQHPFSFTFFSKTYLQKIYSYNVEGYFESRFCSRIRESFLTLKFSVKHPSYTEASVFAEGF